VKIVVPNARYDSALSPHRSYSASFLRDNDYRQPKTTVVNSARVNLDKYLILKR